MARLVVVVSLAWLATACEPPADAESYFGRPDHQIRPPPVTVEAVDLPRSCVDSVAEVRTMARTRSIHHDRDGLGSNARRELAARLVLDVAFMDGDLVVLDAAGERVLWYAGDDVHPSSWKAGTDTVPMAVGLPVFMTVDETAGLVVVADPNLNRISYFGRDRRLVRSREVSDLPVGPIAVSNGGGLYVSRPVLGKAFIEEAEAQVLVARMGAGALETTPAIEVHRDDIVPPRFILPGPNPVRIVRGRDRTALLFPAAGVAQVIRDNGEDVLIGVCVPPELASMYQTQLERAGENTTRQIWTALATDVFLDDSGDIFLVGPSLDQDGRYHVARFRADGTPAGSIVATPVGLNLHGIIRFGRSPYELIGFNTWGDITVVELRKPEG